MPAERRERVAGIGIVRVNGQPEELDGPDGRRQPSIGGTSRISREAYVRICERLGVKLPGATRRSAGDRRPYADQQPFRPTTGCWTKGISQQLSAILSAVANFRIADQPSTIWSGRFCFLPASQSDWFPPIAAIPS